MEKWRSPTIGGRGEIIDKGHQWKIRKLNEVAHMLGFNNLLCRPNAEKNTIWESTIKKEKGKLLQCIALVLAL